MTVGKSGLEEVGKERRSESQDQEEVLVLTGFNMASSTLEYEGSMVTFVVYIQIALAITCNGPFNIHLVQHSVCKASLISSESSSQLQSMMHILWAGQ